MNGTNVYYNGGNVGIGTASPGAPLQVQGDIRSSTGIFSNTEGNDYIQINPADDSFRFFANGTERLSVTSAGNVGIGTVSPGAKLAVSYSSGQRGVESTGPSGNSHIPYSNGSVYLSGNDIFFRNASNGTLMTILNEGNVGIGTAAPVAKLDVVGGNTILDKYVYIRDYDDGNISNPVQLISRDGNLVVWNTGLVVGNPGNGSLSDLGAGNAYISGDVGIGTANPSEKLHVTGIIRSDIGFQIGSGVNFEIESSGRISSEAGGQFDGRMIFTSGSDMYGNVWVNGTIDYYDAPTGNGHFVCRNTNIYGRLRHQSAPCNQSDARLKEKIAPLKAGLEEILKLKPVTFEWKDKKTSGEGTKLGLIAQDVMEVFPELVTGSGTGEDGEWYGVDYTALTAPMIKAIQELKAENDRQDAENEALRVEMSELRKEIEKFKQ
ncbi:hypothetical protein C4585_00560 [Candidatus Parcubacteria bacterium]|nr:MAG: hypothetical protein C4585_00560 [Candidatus Parcubacteria bacterium]